MKVLLLGNYLNLRQESMQRFAEMLANGLRQAGCDVRLVRPPLLLGRMFKSRQSTFAKWVGYVDCFIFYPAVLFWQSRWADVVHVCDHANSVYIPSLLRKPNIVTCHDMLAIRAARGEILDTPTGLTGRVYQSWILRSLKLSDFVACVSSQTYQETTGLTGLPPGRINVVPNALNYPYRPMGQAEISEQLRRITADVQLPFFLHVGGNQWYKNRSGVLRIFAELAKDDRYQAHKLVMVGKAFTGEMERLADELNLHERLVKLEAVSNEELRALYSAADALLFPSLYEGFGWPILEAQACGCLVITSDRSPMTETSGGSAVLIDPGDPRMAAATIISSWTRRDELIQAGSVNATHYDVPNMVRKYMATYLSILSRNKRNGFY